MIEWLCKHIDKQEEAFRDRTRRTTRCACGPATAMKIEMGMAIWRVAQDDRSGPFGES